MMINSVIYSTVPKMDSKQFVVKSNKTHIILNAKIIKLIKYKVFYKDTNKKIYQRYITRDYFNNKCGTPRFLCTFLLHYKKILAYTELRMLSYRYLRRYFPEDLKDTIINDITKELFKREARSL